MAASMLSSSREEAAAFMTPALKAAPDGFSSIAAAEAAGWIYNATTQSWQVPSAQIKRLKGIEERLAGMNLTDDRVDAMSLHELRRALDAMRDGMGISTQQAGAVPELFTMDEDEDTLRANLKHYSRHLHSTIRIMRKSKSFASSSSREQEVRDEPAASACSEDTAGHMHIATTCKACGKEPRAGGKLLSCGKCHSTQYCDTQCQTADWPQHKAACRRAAASREEAAAAGVDMSKMSALHRWYGTVPDLGEKVICMAWQHRAETPFIVVQGGVNAHMANACPIARRLWGTNGVTQDTANVLGYVSMPDFRQDVHYVVMIKAGHAGTERWPSCTVRCKFPFPADQMEAWVKGSAAARLKAEQRSGGTTAAAAAPRVRVAGLGSAGAVHLNGQEGVRGAWDAEVERFHVRLDSGKAIRVKLENLESVERVDTAHTAHGDNHPRVPVRLRGLSGAAHLNGQQGVRGALDRASGRFNVRLSDGRQIGVKPENLEVIGHDV